MARTALTTGIVAIPSIQNVTVVADAQDIPWESSDTANGIEFPASGRDLILAINTDAGAQTITIDAPPDAAGREGVITAYSLGAGEVAWFGMFDTGHWRQTDGMIHVDTSDDLVEVCVFRLP